MLKKMLLLMAWGLLPCQPSAAWQQVVLDCYALTESSGLAASTLDRNVVWTHNDSGDRPRLFAFSRDGEWLAEVELEGAKAYDWEDMCSFQRDGKSYLAVGDVGDNSRGRSTVVIYVFEEPPLEGLSKRLLPKLRISQLETIEVVYPTGAVDCESLAYDPRLDRFLLATKELLRCRLFTCDAHPAATKQPLVAECEQTLILPLTTAADISPDGSRLVIATYGPACLLTRGADKTWETPADTLELPPRRQGETICFADGGSKLLLTSEFVPTPLWTLPVPTK